MAVRQARAAGLSWSRRRRERAHGTNGEAFPSPVDVLILCDDPGQGVVALAEAIGAAGVRDVLVAARSEEAGWVPAALTAGVAACAVSICGAADVGEFLSQWMAARGGP